MLARWTAFAAIGAVAAGCISITRLPGATPVVPSPSAVAVTTPAPTASPTVPITPTLEPATPTLPATPSPLPATTAPGADVTSEEALLATMLEPADVDDGAESRGVSVGTTASDLPTFAAVGGLRRAAQTIDVDDGLTVYDFRYQFATPEDATTFLDAEESGLGEVHNGGTLSEPPEELGDDTRYYTAHTEIFVIQDSFNYLIRVGNVVAKIWIGGDPGIATEERAALIAQAAADRMEVALGG